MDLVGDLRLVWEKNSRLVEKIKKSDCILQVEPTNFTGRVAAVDSGVACINLSGIDVICIKPALDVFTYVNGSLTGSEFLPSKIPVPKSHCVYSDDNVSFSIYKSLRRLKEELTLALRAVEQTDVLLMDGSIVIELSDKPSFDSVLFEKYKEICTLYAQLYEKCTEKKVTLVGVVKDSRGKRFSKHYFENIPLNEMPGSDDMLFSELLNPLQRTKALTYAKNPETHTLLADIGGLSKDIHTFYVRTAKDAPLRIEYLTKNPEDDATKISSMLAGFTKNSKIGYPPILVNVDLRACIKPGELETSLGKENFDVLSTFNVNRRDSRPFR